MNELINTVARIEALIDRTDLGGLAWDLASKSVDAILEDGTEKHTGWDASLAIEFAAPQVEGIEDLTADEGAEALEAVETAIKKIAQLAAVPLGVVLVNADDGHVWGLGEDIEAAQAEINSSVRVPLVWDHVTASVFTNPRGTRMTGAGRYRAYEIATLDYAAEDGEFVRAFGKPVGYWLARDVAEQAA